MKLKLLILSVILSFFSVSTALAQCPMCVTAVEEARKNGTQVGSTLNNGILYLLALPYTIAIVFGFLYWRNQRAKKKILQQP